MGPSLLLKSDADIALEAMVPLTFIVSQYGRAEVCHGWESRLGYDTRGKQSQKV